MHTRPDGCDWFGCDQTATEFREHHGERYQWCAKHDALVGQDQRDARALVAEAQTLLQELAQDSNPPTGTESDGTP